MSTVGRGHCAKGPHYEERPDEEQLARLAERIGSTQLETMVLFADETEVKRFPPLRCMWQPVGEQKAV